MYNYIALEHIEAGTGRAVGWQPVAGSQIRSNKFRFGDRHVLFGKLRPYLNKVLLPSFSGICSTDILPLLPAPNITREWLAICLRSPQFMEFARAKMEGTKMPRLRTVDFRQYRFPVPPLAEQRRIVEHVDRLLAGMGQAANAASDAVGKATAALASFHADLVNDADGWLPLDEVAELVRRPVKPHAATEYEEMGVRSFGNGTFQKPRLTGRQLGKKRVYWIHAGDLVFNNVFAWEGAVAVAQPEDQGRVGSHRFITYVPNPDEPEPNRWKRDAVTSPAAFRRGQRRAGGKDRDVVSCRTL
ncbi:MAG: restriction endonuclease subunit S [Planctomycetes bacterium]|nr:restriction endonuclease subunit S [Planctomycetota bacterium]